MAGVAVQSETQMLVLAGVQVEVVVRGLYNSRYVFLIIFLFVIFNCTLGLSWFSQVPMPNCVFPLHHVRC